MDFMSLENKRKSCVKIVVFGYIIAVVGALLTFGLYENQFIGFIVLVIGGILLISGYGNFSSISKDFKNKYLKELIKETFENSSYFPNKGVNVNDVYSSDLVKKADRYHTEDLITGTFDGVNFMTSDVKLEERHVRRTKNGTQVYYVTYFLGRYFSFDFPKDFKSKILVTEGSLMTWFSSYKKIELESVEFNKKFNIYTKNEHDAFYVLTPHLMESILQLEKQNPGSIGLTFTGNRLIVLINNGINTFELSLFKRVDQTVINNLNRDLAVIKKIINDLKLNRKIFVD